MNSEKKNLRCFLNDFLFSKWQTKLKQIKIPEIKNLKKGVEIISETNKYT